MSAEVKGLVERPGLCVLAGDGAVKMKIGKCLTLQMRRFIKAYLVQTLN